MPVFRHASGRCYALINYKVLYTSFCSANSWQEVGRYPSPPNLFRSILRDHSRQTFLLMRSPYDRVISCFMDKFRLHPQNWHRDGFRWQHCQKLLFPFCDIQGNTDNEAIADRLLRLSFDDFLEILPRIYRRNAHYHPQNWQRILRCGPLILATWPSVQILNIESAEHRLRIPDIDWTVKYNATSHIDRDFELSETAKITIQRLYGKDFVLGGYAF